MVPLGRKTEDGRRETPEAMSACALALSSSSASHAARALKMQGLPRWTAPPAQETPGDDVLFRAGSFPSLNAYCQ
jgi:hypothetical protein